MTSRNYASIRTLGTSRPPPPPKDCLRFAYSKLAHRPSHVAAVGLPHASGIVGRRHHTMIFLRYILHCNFGLQVVRTPDCHHPPWAASSQAPSDPFLCPKSNVLSTFYAEGLSLLARDPQFSAAKSRHGRSCLAERSHCESAFHLQTEGRVVSRRS